MFVDNVLVPLMCQPEDEQCAPTVRRYYDENSANVDAFYRPYYDAIVTVATTWVRSICATHAINSDPQVFANDFSVCMRSALDSSFPFFKDFKVEALGELSSYESVFAGVGHFLSGLAVPSN